MDTTGGGETGTNAAVQHGDPAHRQSYFARNAEVDVWRDLQRLQVNVWLVEAVEKYQAINALLIDASSEMCEVREERAELHRDRDFQLRFQRRDNREVA